MATYDCNLPGNPACVSQVSDQQEVGRSSVVSFASKVIKIISVLSEIDSNAWIGLSTGERERERECICRPTAADTHTMNTIIGI